MARGGATSALRGIDISERLLRRLELRCAEAIMDSERAPERMDALLEPARWRVAGMAERLGQESVGCRDTDAGLD